MLSRIIILININMTDFELLAYCLAPFVLLGLIAVLIDYIARRADNL